ncbi:MAG: alanyl-tRNA synthetase, alanyl-tRNA synthetase [Parcubacteria group bacterium]|nr:alanyl-tRNA synthetase, alanyl-tRNA synthetase [Parcubacteria group bacterium]
MNSEEIRKRFLAFFEKRGHAIIPSASLVPENDPSVLFNTAGMQPLVPYLLGEPHPAGKRIADVQKCVRTQDIDEVGDNTHDTFFEMLGNWSLGDYFKEEAIKWSFELLTNKEEGFGLDPKRLYITVFEGDANAPRDDEAFNIWKEYMPENRIYFMSAKSNWWSAGDSGPCGPDTEMFYDITSEGLGDMSKEEYMKADAEQKVVEIWNDVFMEYMKQDGKVIGKLPQKNVDTGAGLERLAMVLQHKENIFDTDLFSTLMEKIQEGTIRSDSRARVIADHIRTSVFMINDGVLPANSDRGYILRRLLRRAYLKARNLNLDLGTLHEVALSVMLHPSYAGVYTFDQDRTFSAIHDEIHKFKETLDAGLKEFEKGTDAFTLFTTHGFPYELTEELHRERGTTTTQNISGVSNIMSKAEFDAKFKAHQDLSRAGAEQKFKGGMADNSEMSVKYHTATHLLHQALRDVLGDEVGQKGSNITPERLRFDFTFSRKMTDEEKKKVEDIVNEKIEAKLPMNKVVLPKAEAEKTGALHFFGEKYPDEVSVYYIGDSLETAYSKEFCGGPHVSNTSELGRFKIQKEEAVSAGVRRIKAIME